MAVITEYSLQFLLECVRKEHDLEDDVLKVALMDTTFAFDSTTDGTWADVSASEIADGNGYTTGGATLTTVAAAIDTVTDKVDITADNVTWTASTGAIATTGAAIIYNSSHASNTIVMCIDFGADYATADGKLFQLNFASDLANIYTG